MTIKAEYLIDEKGQKKSVVLSIEDYLRLWEYLQDLEDTLDLKKAKTSGKKFVDFDSFTRKLKSRGWIH